MPRWAFVIPVCPPSGRPSVNNLFKHLLLWNRKAQTFDNCHVASTNGPVPSLFKLSPPGQKWPHPGAYKFFIGKSLKTIFYETINRQEKANAGNVAQKIHPPLKQSTLIHTQTHTYCQSYINSLKIPVRHTLNKGEYKGAALVIYYWGLKPVCVRTTSLLAPIPTL